MIRFFADPTGSPNVPAQKKLLTKLTHTNLSTEIHVVAEVHRTTRGQKQNMPSQKLDHVEKEGRLD